MQIAFVIALAVTLLAFGVHFGLVGFGVYSDGLGYYAPLRSLVFDHDLRVDDEYAYFAGTASAFGGGARFAGRPPEYSVYPIGMGLVLSPFFGLGHLFTLALRGLEPDMALDGYAWPYEFFYCIGSILFGVAGLMLCYAAMKKR
ncbi:MAG: hypothetical protein JXB04_07710, partial [Kiritimatiellae bacterium]|nr:hypothetical protein [Kiritimatiellia bacterium]